LSDADRQRGLEHCRKLAEEQIPHLAATRDRLSSNLDPRRGRATCPRRAAYCGGNSADWRKRLKAARGTRSHRLAPLGPMTRPQRPATRSRWLPRTPLE
jgi:hypothetical protein